MATVCASSFDLLVFANGIGSESSLLAIAHCLVRSLFSAMCSYLAAGSSGVFFVADLVFMWLSLSGNDANVKD